MDLQPQIARLEQLLQGAGVPPELMGQHSGEDPGSYRSQHGQGDEDWGDGTDDNFKVTLVAAFRLWVLPDSCGVA